MVESLKLNSISKKHQTKQNPQKKVETPILTAKSLQKSQRVFHGQQRSHVTLNRRPDFHQVPNLTSQLGDGLAVS